MVRVVRWARRTRWYDDGAARPVLSGRSARLSYLNAACLATLTTSITQGTASFLVYLTIFVVAWLAWNTMAP
ncbi:hypothetical protein R6G99_08800, partial [Actinotignum timonense]|nr:hypothetical protein [Actinotignum timonense]